MSQTFPEEGRMNAFDMLMKPKYLIWLILCQKNTSVTVMMPSVNILLNSAAISDLRIL